MSRSHTLLSHPIASDTTISQTTLPLSTLLLRNHPEVAVSHLSGLFFDWTFLCDLAPTTAILLGGMRRRSTILGLEKTLLRRLLLLDELLGEVPRIDGVRCAVHSLRDHISFGWENHECGNEFFRDDVGLQVWTELVDSPLAELLLCVYGRGTDHG